MLGSVSSPCVTSSPMIQSLTGEATTSRQTTHLINNNNNNNNNLDTKYWERRRKNNVAAKKSRDARRVRENQLKVKVICLEKANAALKAQIRSEREENKQLRDRLQIYEKQRE